MTRGAETPEDLRLKFRAEYLISGNAADAARKTGIPESTGRDIAKELNVSVDFVEDRRVLRASYLEECVNLRMKMVRKAFKRFDDDTPPEPGEIDKRPDYGRLVTDAEKNAHNLAKIERENEGTGPANTEVHIHLTKDDGEPSQAP
jgi:hypothetical protein